MRRAALAVLFGCLVLLGAASPARAWSDATRLRMVRDALKVTPPALDAVLDHYRRELERGMLALSKHEEEEVHYQNVEGGGLAAAAAARKSREALALLSEKGRLKRFAFEMGTLAHLVSDVSFPLNASDADPREPLYREAYRAYVESVLDKIPFVLDTTPAPALDRGDLEGYLQERARRAGRGYAAIGAAFKDDGTPRTADALDERSIPFGISSLAYSQAVNDIARLWAAVWQKSGGDMTPPAVPPGQEAKRAEPGP
jgi:hypothetical protein